MAAENPQNVLNILKLNFLMVVYVNNDVSH